MQQACYHGDADVVRKLVEDGSDQQLTVLETFSAFAVLPGSCNCGTPLVVLCHASTIMSLCSTRR